MEDIGTVKQGTDYSIISGHKLTNMFVFDVKKIPQRHCQNPGVICLTNYESFYVETIGRGFDMRSGRNFGKKRNGPMQLLQKTAHTQEK